MHRPGGSGPWRRTVDVVVAGVVVVGPVVLVELVDVDVLVLVLVDVVLEVAEVEVEVDGGWSENRHPRAGGRNVAGLLIGGEGRVVGVPVPVPEVVVVVGVTGAVVDVAGPTAVVVVIRPVVAEAPRSIRWTANPTTSRVASETLRTSRSGQRRVVSSG